MKSKNLNKSSLKQKNQQIDDKTVDYLKYSLGSKYIVKKTRCGIRIVRR